MKVARRFLGAMLPVLAAVLLASGCGGGGDGGGTFLGRAIGVFEGRQEGTTETTGRVELDLREQDTRQTGTGVAVTGNARFTRDSDGEIFLGTVTGTLNGEQIAVNVTYNKAFGQVSYSGTVNNQTGFDGTFTRGTETGTVDTVRVSERSTDINGLWGFDESDPEFGINVSLRINFRQNNNNVTGTFTTTASFRDPETGQTETFRTTGNISGIIVGNRLLDGRATYTFEGEEFIEPFEATVEGNIMTVMVPDPESPESPPSEFEIRRL